MAPNSQTLAQRRSLALHRRIADRLREEPALLELARRRVASWLASGHRSSDYLRLWSRLLEGPADGVIEALTEDTERGRELRGASPFAGIVDPKERWALWQSEREALESERP